MKAADEVIEVNREELQGLLERKRETLGEEDYQKLQKLLRAFSYLADLIGEKDTTISQLRALLMKPSTEKTSRVLEQAGLEAAQKNPPSRLTTNQKPKPGHGRNGAGAYCGAVQIPIAHRSLNPGDRCPECLKGKVYEQKKPGLRIRLVGHAPIAATVYELERLRCNLCGEVFEAEAPEGVGEKKYDESAAAMIALLMAGLLLFVRGRPGWRRIWYSAAGVDAVGDCRRTGRRDSVRFRRTDPPGGTRGSLSQRRHQDAILSPDRESAPALGSPEESSRSSERTGLFTSGIVSTKQGQRIALFFTGRRHAGENFAQVLARRAAGLPPPIQMADGLSWNFAKLPKTLQVIIGNCNAHSRRRFVEVVSNFPEECRYVLESLAEVYGYEAQAEERGLSAEERLRFHQEHSGPVMKRLHAWMLAQFAEKRVEPNSGLGSAMTYYLKHWERLTLFLRQAGAPLDNNLVERASKKAILHRKNSLFYKTENGAEVGDLFMSFIHTCELNDVNPFAYLVELQKHAEEAARNPSAWMPWNYREALARAGIGTGI